MRRKNVASWMVYLTKKEYIFFASTLYTICDKRKTWKWHTIVPCSGRYWWQRNLLVLCPLWISPSFWPASRPPPFSRRQMIRCPQNVPPVFGASRHRQPEIDQTQKQSSKISNVSLENINTGITGIHYIIYTEALVSTTDLSNIYILIQ